MSARTILKHLHQQGRMTDYQFDVINRNLRERPQGEWIGVVYSENRIGVGMCNQCGVNRIIDNFCSNCGADMRGGRE